MGRQRAGEERPRRRTKSQAPSARKLKPRWPFSRAREAISGPILRTRFWSRKRDHAADARWPQMAIPCMTSSEKSNLWTPRIVARGPVFWTTRWSSNRDRFLTQSRCFGEHFLSEILLVWAPRRVSGNLPWGALGLARPHLRRYARLPRRTLNRPRWRWRGADATRAQAEKRALPCSSRQGLWRDSRFRPVAPQSLSHRAVPK